MTVDDQAGPLDDYATRRTREGVMAAWIAAAVLAACIAVAPPLLAKGSSHGSAHPYSSRSPGGSSHSQAVPGVKRDSSGKIARSPQAKHDFQKSNPCPSTGKSSGSCPGYVINHVNPLKRGGADAPSNLQWQTIEQAKHKDRWE